MLNQPLNETELLQLFARSRRPQIMMAPGRGPDSTQIQTWLQQLISAEADLSIRIEAASQLIELENSESHLSIIQAFLSLLKEESEPRLLMHVISILARKRVRAAVTPLIDLALATRKTAIEKAYPDFSKSDLGLRIRIAAVQSLGRLQDEQALLPLMDLMGNQKENYRLRLSAAESLGKLGDRQATNPLLDIVNDEQEQSTYLKESAIKALGMLGDIRALDPLLDLFETKQGFKNKFHFLKEQIVEAIGRLGSHHNSQRRAQQALLSALKDDAASIRLSAVEALVEVGDEACIPALKDRLFDTEDDVAIAAVSALFHLGGEPLIRTILAQQENIPQFVREELETYVP